MQRSELPNHLGNAFTVADARAAGVAPSRLRASDLVKPFHGVRSRTLGEPALGDRKRSLQELQHMRLALMYATCMPDSQFFSHVTAALLWGLPVPRRLLGLIDVAVMAPGRGPAGRNVRGHQLKPSLITTRVHPEFGVRVTSPASTWAVLGGIVDDLCDLVAIADAVVREPMFKNDSPSLGTTAQLQAVIDSGRRLGVNRLRAALPLVRTRSASWPETRCRLALGDAGLPEPQLNWTVLDADGRFVACVDLAYPELKIAIEYEGEHHLIDPGQWARDIERHARLVELGWIVIRVTKRQLRGDAIDFTGRVRRALALHT